MTVLPTNEAPPAAPTSEVTPDAPNGAPKTAPPGEATAAPPRTPKIIKRYSNRKLYDTERSKYVTLDEIAQMIKAGEDVAIIDNKSKGDLTSVTLTQIIFEEEKRKSRMPLSMLRNLIQAGEGALQEFLDRSVMTPVAEMRDTAQKGVEELQHRAAELKTAATRSVSELTDTARRVFGRNPDGGPIVRRFEEAFKSGEAALEDLKSKLDEGQHEAAELTADAVRNVAIRLRNHASELEAVASRLEQAPPATPAEPASTSTPPPSTPPPAAPEG